MLMQMFHKRGKRGFTLVELLIVVAIIGVLSTIGVPTFRRMIQKSKKSEAKVNLGGVYTTESAFYAEYNYYGNNLTRMGFEIDGSASSLIYTVGYYTAACANSAAINPPTGTTLAINAAFPAYYTAANTRAGAVNSTVCGQAFDVPAAGTTFTAGASGAIAPSTVVATNANIDIWSIDNTRKVSNIQDGVQ
jgi:prepilin-type N-terminal cleavage/methylation domain-containing protein